MNSEPDVPCRCQYALLRERERRWFRLRIIRGIIGWIGGVLIGIGAASAEALASVNVIFVLVGMANLATAMVIDPGARFLKRHTGDHSSSDEDQIRAKSA